jgi:hypothetical protein
MADEGRRIPLGMRSLQSRLLMAVCAAEWESEIVVLRRDRRPCRWMSLEQSWNSLTLLTLHRRMLFPYQQVQALLGLEIRASSSGSVREESR